MKKIIFILIDGCNLPIAKQCLSFLAALSASKKVDFLKHQCALPPISRPLYFNILSGLLPIESGITHNTIWKPCKKPTIFSVAQENNLHTAAASYYWISELCNTSPFDPKKHRITNGNLPIAHGIFYFNNEYPDNHVFADAEALRINNKPDFLLVHCMGVDSAGHNFGADSTEYKKAAENINQLLAEYLPSWLNAGYSIIVTSDHGMDENGKHYDDNPLVREIPVWTIGCDLPPPKVPSHWFDFCCKYLGIKPKLI